MRAPVRPVRVVFLDDGGVLNDNERRAPGWRRLLGEFFAPRFGGTPRAWGDANWTIFSEILGDWSHAQQSHTPLAPDWFAQQDERWLTGMFERVGVPVPTDISGTVRASKAHVMDHIDCAYPEAGPAVRAMHQRGIALHMASSGVSTELAPYLARMGILALFDRLYGPDLIGTHKTSSRFYERIAEDSGVDPDTAIVVDDNAQPLEWAAGAGFRTVHVDRVGAGSRFDRITSLDQLLPMLDGLRG